MKKFFAATLFLVTMMSFASFANESKDPPKSDDGEAPMLMLILL